MTQVVNICFEYTFHSANRMAPGSNCHHLFEIVIKEIPAPSIRNDFENTPALTKQKASAKVNTDNV